MQADALQSLQCQTVADVSVAYVSGVVELETLVSPCRLVARDDGERQRRLLIKKISKNIASGSVSQGF